MLRRVGFYDVLTERTKADQEQLLAIPVLRRALAGDIARETYLSFLAQAYHHVKHTEPLLMAAGARLPQRCEWLRREIARYIAEELGHEQWILEDLAACGVDPGPVARATPDFPCELMVAYAYDVVQRGNPVGIFAMVHVLEGTSTRVACRAAGALQQHLGLPDTALRYLTSHGELDRGHVQFFRSLMDRIVDHGDQEWILHCAPRFFRLYGDVFRALPGAAATQAR
jgi:pyrroloquinoline quinone (PQQ) biosynthesis protein C